jgi:hypothetical protein
VEQFHALPAGPKTPPYPPIKDPSTESFILGQTAMNGRQGDAELYGQLESQIDDELTSVDTMGEQRYLVQRLGGGTWCDLIKKNRKIEVQFQCDPSGADRIDWIKETSTCSYLIVVHTPKLCNDLAFTPVKQINGEGVNEIVCRKIGTEEIGHANEESQLPGLETLQLPLGITDTTEDVPITKPLETESADADAKTGYADYLEFIVPSAPLDTVLSLLEKTIAEQIQGGTFLRPDGSVYNPEDDEPIEYRVELIDDEEDKMFGLLNIQIGKHGVVKVEIVDDENKGKTDPLPEALRQELKDWVEGRDTGTSDSSKDEGED